MKCAKCNYDLKPSSKFCARCGASLSSVSKQNIIALGITLFGLFIIMMFFALLQDYLKQKSPENITKAVEASASAAETPFSSPTPTPTPSLDELKKIAQSLSNFTTDEYTKADLEKFENFLKSVDAIPKDSADYRKAQELRKKVGDRAAVIAAEILVLGEKPKNSEWDGSVLPAQRYLKKTLHDYSSSEYLGWSPVVKVYIKKEPFWATRVRIRAKNAFGAYVVNEIYFLIRGGEVVKAENL